MQIERQRYEKEKGKAKERGNEKEKEKGNDYLFPRRRNCLVNVPII